MSVADHLTRRSFVKSLGFGAGGLVIGFTLPVSRVLGNPPRNEPNVTDVNAFVRIDPNGEVTLTVGKSEMGQGTFTGYAQLVAEELEVDWRSIRVQSAPVASIYNGTDSPEQYTGGSASIATGFTAMREAGATAREALIAAAAEILQVPATELGAEHGTIVHDLSGRRIKYEDVARHAVNVSVTQPVKLKPSSEWKLIGTSAPRVDSKEKCNGTALFGLDVRLPNLHYAMVARAPRFGAVVGSCDSKFAREIPGVVAVVQVPTGIAVIATNTWVARKGRDALKVEWNGGVDVSTEKLAESYRQLAQVPGDVTRSEGTVGALETTDGTRVAADYATPYLAHAAMEPLNCTVSLSPDGCDIYCGSQAQTSDRNAAAEVCGLPVEQVRVHSMYIGGGFGRRSLPNADFVREAVAIAMSFDKPVMTVWSREDDMRGGFYRPLSHSRMTATLAADGRPNTWTHTLVVQPITIGTSAEAGWVDRSTGLETLAHEGASSVPYAIPNIRVDIHQQRGAVPVLWMRSVGHGNNAFAVESLIDECAYAAGQDPLHYRLSLLQHKPKHKAAIELAAEKFRWGDELLPGRARGIAVHEMRNSVVAEAVEVSLEDGKPRVHRVVAAIHCGTAINPRAIAQQLEGAVNFGLSAALYSEISIEDGQVVQTNFDDYEIARLRDAPRVEAYIVPSNEEPTGVGEMGVAPIAAAVANALFSLTGVRARRLPLKHTTFAAAHV